MPPGAKDGRFAVRKMGEYGTLYFDFMNLFRQGSIQPITAIQGR